MTSKVRESKKLAILNFIREPVDKIYFRKRDEASMYAEFLFKSKVWMLLFYQTSLDSDNKEMRKDLKETACLALNFKILT